MQAYAVCTTPHTCNKNAYAKFNHDVAKGVVLDDAGSLHAANALHIWGCALHIWGCGCRPCILSGDRTQPTPVFVKSHGRRRNGRCMNIFLLYGRVSVLRRLERVGWPWFEV